MRYARRHHKRDGNHAQIVAELRQAGFSVLDLSQIGHGAPDLLVGRGGRDLLVEIKLPTPGSHVSALQALWADAWRGARPLVARSVTDVLNGW